MKLTKKEKNAIFEIFLEYGRISITGLQIHMKLNFTEAKRLFLAYSKTDNLTHN